jgi:hypothetical protein
MEQLSERRVGYDRLVGEHAYRQLTELYRALRLYINCFQPSMKLLSKQREGKKVRCVYDPAKSPLQRLFLSGVLPAVMQQKLTDVARVLDPICLLNQLVQLQQAVFRCAASCSPFVPNTPSAPLCIFCVDDCMTGMLPIRNQRFTPCTASRSGENGSWAGGVPTKIPLRESGSRSTSGWWPILIGAVATSSGSCSAALLAAIANYKSAHSSAACGKYEPT